MDDAAGVLAIFNNVTPAREAEFEQWFQQEHLAERLAVPGFLLGRRYEAVSGDRRYFNYYLTRSPDVLASPAYLARVNDPTPMTRRVMSEVFRDMIRTVCRQRCVRGAARGAAAVAVRFHQPTQMALLQQSLEELTRDGAASWGAVWEAASPPDLPASEEERLRGGDARVEACLLLETLRVAEAERLGSLLAQGYGTGVGVFRLLCDVRTA